MRMSTGDRIRVINTHGHQVVDTWAFGSNDPREHMSMEHSRAAFERLTPRVGDTLVTNRRRPILTLVADTSPGLHDTLIAACDSDRYRILCGDELHDNCCDNLRRALGELGIARQTTPCPLNLFMNVATEADGSLSLRPPLSAAGDHVDLQAEMDLILVLSACPQDISPVNGFVPCEVHFALHPAVPGGTGFA